MFLINTAMEKISIGTAALIVVLGMAVVFFGLILLMFVTKIAGAIINRKNTAAPAAAPAAMAAGMARKGCPATATVADTAHPRVKAPSVVISAMFSTRKLKNSAIATSA